jgi:hypothetical protein
MHGLQFTFGHSYVYGSESRLFNNTSALLWDLLTIKTISTYKQLIRKRSIIYDKIYDLLQNKQVLTQIHCTELNIFLYAWTAVHFWALLCIRKRIRATLTLFYFLFFTL